MNVQPVNNRDQYEFLNIAPLFQDMNCPLDWQIYTVGLFLSVIANSLFSVEYKLMAIDLSFCPQRFSKHLTALDLTKNYGKQGQPLNGKGIAVMDQ